MTISLLATILGGVAIIGGAVWRVASAVFSLAYEVRLGSYRLDRIEKRLGVDGDPLPPIPPRRPRPRRRVGLPAPAPGRNAGGQEARQRRETA